MNIMEFVKTFLKEGVIIKDIKKIYHKYLILRVTTNCGVFDIHITENVRKQLSYYMNDIVKMNITYNDIKDILTEHKP